MKKTGFTISFEDGETLTRYLTPVLQAEYIATISPKKFDGSYGIDWCEISADFTKIEKFQETNVADISHILEKATAQFKASPTTQDKQIYVRELYNIENYYEKDIPITWINLAKDKVATLEITPLLVNGKVNRKTDFLTIEKNINFKIAHNGTTDEGDNPNIKIENLKDSKGQEIEITALNTFAQPQEIIIKDYLGVEVGKIEMAANNVQNLNVKIIPVILKSNQNKETEDSIKLYNNAIKAKTNNLGNSLNETLNKHSLNQAGIKSQIESIKSVPERIIVDLTKDNWSKFYDSAKKEFKDWEFTPTEPSATKRPPIWTSEDGDKIYEYKNGTTNNDKRLLLDELEDAYYAEYGRNFKGALLFVTEENYYKPDTLGYSQNNPIRSQGTIIFKGGLSMSDAYAHELGHMLGLEHVFLKTDEIVGIKNNITTQNSNISNYEGNIQNRKELIEDQNKRIIRETKRTKELGYNDDGTVDDQDFINDQEILINNHKTKIEEYNKEIKEFEAKIEDFKRKIAIEKGRGLKIKKGTSNNFMDYDISRLYFDKFQCLVMQQEIKSFYNE